MSRECDASGTRVGGRSARVESMEGEESEAPEEKAVLFSVPRRLADCTIAFPRAQGRVGLFDRLEADSVRREIDG